ncbi:hypothetical protein D3C78_1357770 [compost metagenome]
MHSSKPELLRLNRLNIPVCLRQYIQPCGCLRKPCRIIHNRRVSALCANERFELGERCAVFNLLAQQLLRLIYLLGLAPKHNHMCSERQTKLSQILRSITLQCLN